MQSAGQDRAVFRSVRKGGCGQAPSGHARLMRIEAAAQKALHGQARLTDRLDQLDYALSLFHLCGADGDGGADRLSRIEDRLGRIEAEMQEQSTQPLLRRLDRLTEMMATLSTRALVQSTPDANAEAAPEGDLHTLPGLGPGLIRLLEKAGLSRIDQLACADAVRLRDALGPVGDVLDTGFLVDRARERVAERAPMRAAS